MPARADPCAMAAQNIGDAHQHADGQAPHVSISAPSAPAPAVHRAHKLLRVSGRCAETQQQIPRVAASAPGHTGLSMWGGRSMCLESKPSVK
eukprot:286172-Prymnesium_polylepis.2